MDLGKGGGVPSFDPRARAVGRAWIELLDIPYHEARSNKEGDAIGCYGGCKGPQTVPRAELTAFMRFLLFLFPLINLIEITNILDVCTDRQTVYDGCCAGYKVTRCSLGDLWAQFWIIYQTPQIL